MWTHKRVAKRLNNNISSIVDETVLQNIERKYHDLRQVTISRKAHDRANEAGCAAARLRKWPGSSDVT